MVIGPAKHTYTGCIQYVGGNEFINLSKCHRKLLNDVTQTLFTIENFNYKHVIVYFRGSPGPRLGDSSRLF